MASLFFELRIFFITLLVSCVMADVSHMRKFNRFQQSRFQRLETNPTPYAAAGFKPDREFNLPQDQPVFPLEYQVSQGNDQALENGNQNQNQNSKNNDNQFEPEQPQLIYGAPARLRYNLANQEQRQQAQRNGNIPEKFTQPKSERLSVQKPQRLSQPKPARLTASPVQQQQQQLQPQLVYNAPQQFVTSSQQLQIVPQSELAALQLQAYQPFQTQQQFFSSPSGQIVGPASQPARLTDNREGNDEDDEDTRANTDSSDTTDTDIETKSKKQDEKEQDAAKTMPTVTYYPAGAFSFVQPVSARYVAAPAGYQVQYFAGSLPSGVQQQQFVLPGADMRAQLQLI